MTTGEQQKKRRRPRSRGVAALEFALSLTFLAPLTGAAVDYGYYFYVGSSAEEAARAGLRQAILKFRADYPGSDCVNAPGVGQKAVVAAYGQNVNTGEAFQVMDQAPLSMKSNTQVLLTCDALPNPPAVNTTWHITVRVDFSPVMGIVAPFMPAGTPGKVRYTARLNGN